MEDMKNYHYNQAINSTMIQERISSLDKLLVLDEILNLPKNIIQKIEETHE